MASIYSEEQTINAEVKVGDKITISGVVKGFTATETGIASVEVENMEVENVEEAKNDLKKSYNKAVEDRTRVEQPIPSP